MRALILPQHLVSKCFWGAIAEVKGEPPEFPPTPVSALPQNLEYLWRYVAYTKPEKVIEVGEGNSTGVMWNAMGNKGRIWTCNRERKEDLTNGSVHCFACESTRMFEQLTEPADFFFFDGRLNREDFDHVRRLSTEETVYFFDDFHGTEKGVVNAFHLKDGRYLMIPCEGKSRSTLAALVPMKMVGFGIYA